MAKAGVDGLMRFAFLVFIPFILSTCTDRDAHPHDKLMDRIEEKLVLPHGAKPISGYERFYTRDGEIVIGTLVLGKSGKRSWVKSISDLPQVFDGGCGVINVRYSPKSDTVENVHCNGVA
ncbi:MAG: hypothetical protein C0491_11670 [Novosphingobium sp.]|nr:hypothetical protein [Novosphingobium sp.]